MSWYFRPKRTRRKPSRTTGRTADVARAMAEGDRDGRAATPEEIGQALGLTASYVRSIQGRIRRQLGGQAC